MRLHQPEHILFWEFMMYALVLLGINLRTIFEVHTHSRDIIGAPKITGLLCGVVCAILCLAISV